MRTRGLLLFVVVDVEDDLEVVVVVVRMVERVVDELVFAVVVVPAGGVPGRHCEYPWNVSIYIPDEFEQSLH